MEVIYADKPIPVRYRGQGSYWVAGYEFTARNRVQLVPPKLAEYLIGEEEALFEIAED